MGTSSVTVKENATSFTIVGGTDQVFVPDGEKVDGGVHLIASGVADFFARPTITIRTRSPKIVNGVTVKGKRWYNLSQPRKTAEGELYYDVMRVEIETSPLTLAADRTSFINKGIHMLFTADLAGFQATGSLA